MSQEEAKIQLIETENSTDYQKVKTLYRQSFPMNERMPLDLLYKKRKKVKAKFYSIYDHEEWVGFVILITSKELVYISYFAIEPKFQSKGYGKKVLDKVKAETNGKRILLAAEKVIEGKKNFEQRCKRIAFYERNGFVFTGYGTHSLNLLIYGGNFEPRDAIALIQECVGGHLGKFLEWLIAKILKKTTK